MVEMRIKPHRQQVDETERRAAQSLRFRRAQVFGVLMVAAAILLWWLVRANPRQLFPPGWWRL
ncbi:MAG: hypothetical protein WCE75_17415 [Terracidiphilus sp.]